MVGSPLRALAQAAKQRARLLQIVAGIVGRLAALLDGEQQFSHRTVEAVAKPRTFQGGRGLAARVKSVTFCFSRLGPGAPERALGARDVSVVGLAVTDVGVEDEGGLGGFVLDQHLGEEGRRDLLRRRLCAAGEDARGFLPPMKQQRMSNQWMPKS